MQPYINKGNIRTFSKNVDPMELVWHQDKEDRTKAGYWSCNLPRYASQLGLGANQNTFW